LNIVTVTDACKYRGTLGSNQDATCSEEQDVNTMSKDNTVNVSEETITSIVDAANHIAEDSDEMRRSMTTVVNALHPSIEQAGIHFGGSTHWDDGDTVEPRTFRIAAVKTGKSWGLVIEYTDAIAARWNGQHWIGWNDQFSHDAINTGLCGSIEIQHAARYHIEHCIELLPEFLGEYCDALQRRHQEYHDLKKKADQIISIVGE